MLASFRLSGPVGANVRVNRDDTVRTKQALQRLGFLTPPEEGLTAIADDAMIDGIVAFQKENGIAKDGAMKPDGPTEKLIRAALFEQESDSDDKGEAAFQIGSSVGEGAANRPADVLAAKRALALADVIAEEDVNSNMASRTFSGAIDSFQGAFNLKRDGKITPGGETERALARVVRPELDRRGGRKFLQVASNGSLEDALRDFGLEESEVHPPFPFENGEEKLPKERDPELVQLLKDWQINRELPGTNHPMLKDILNDMSKLRGMPGAEKNDLVVKIKKFEAIDRNHTGVVGNLRNRFESAESEPYQFPRVLSDNELERFLELDRIAVNISKKINQAGVKVATPSRGPEDPKAVPNSDIRVAAIKKLSSRANLPAALITFFSGISINHYSKFVRIYEAEIERRKRLRGHT